MKPCRQFEIWLADLNPRSGTEAGKVRPVLVVQTDLLNQIPHPSTLICPLTTSLSHGVGILRVPIKQGTADLHQDCEIMIDQMSAIDNRRLIRKIGSLPMHLAAQVRENILIVLDLALSLPNIFKI